MCFLRWEAFINACIDADIDVSERYKKGLTYSCICSLVLLEPICLLWLSTAECALVQLRSIRLPLRSMGLIVL